MTLVGLLPTMVLMMPALRALLSCCRCCARRWGCKNAAEPHSDWYCALTHPAGNGPIWLNIYDHAVVPFENDQIP